ncbi:flagellar hook capping FlgD N-terminal domain-containing protein [Ovoidimarina sediminis]|uniref:flagellar hook capping FlgD N-terminal domain-containing protein n=1 Tax=Ovoidimarina sediminis TaxID=3079856 RepID=UPI002906D464|nr:flagellar hook capping FlgD N-terminal domain-containing protein [Rhodophyticola sp. MJ-SS7]MDU8942583.1 flagellar hook capping FlgD N-terminal domain-containing protein [Rhodophyticola sp. MJ-SS7]
METNTALTARATTGAAATAAAAETQSSSSALSSDFNTFLLMLTTQLQNQDPLNPANSQDFAVDLATFSGVEQQIRTNELLDALRANQSLGGLSSYADWIGQEARAAAPVPFDGQPVEIAVSLPPGADQAVVVVRDAAGQAISEFAIPPGAQTATWDGRDAFGVPAPPGLYSFAVDAAAEGESLPGATAETYNRVAEVRLEGGVPVIVFEGGTAVEAGAVTALRAPTA